MCKKTVKKQKKDAIDMILCYNDTSYVNNGCTMETERKRTKMRIAKWDNAKFFLIYCVVFGHVAAAFDTPSAFLTGIHYFIYIFHMPAFLFLSGLLSKRSIQNARYEKALNYLILYLFMKLFRFLVYKICLGSNGGISLFEESGVPWFAFTLFFYYIITIAIRNWTPVHGMVVFVLLGMMAGYDKQLGDFLTGMRLFTFYPFFLAGYYTSAESLRKITCNIKVKIVSAVVLLGMLWISFSDMEKMKLTFLKGKTSYEALDLLPYGGLYRGVYYAVVLVVIVCLLSWIPEKELFISPWGKRSIQVYALHYPIVKVLMDRLGMEALFARIWPEHYALLVPVLALALTVVLSLKVWEPLFQWMMNPVKKKD